jgi:hypothetical protein
MTFIGPKVFRIGCEIIAGFMTPSKTILVGLTTANYDDHLVKRVEPNAEQYNG